jgi:hypothetical protein
MAFRAPLLYPAAFASTFDAGRLPARPVQSDLRELSRLPIRDRVAELAVLIAMLAALAIGAGTPKGEVTPRIARPLRLILVAVLARAVEVTLEGRVCGLDADPVLFLALDVPVMIAVREGS